MKLLDGVVVAVVYEAVSPDSDMSGCHLLSLSGLISQSIAYFHLVKGRFYRRWGRGYGMVARESLMPFEKPSVVRRSFAKDSVSLDWRSPDEATPLRKSKRAQTQSTRKRHA